MHFQELLAGLSYELHGLPFSASGLNYDSRKIRPGDVFVALRGLRFDGHDFGVQAEQGGAVAVVVERLIPDLDLPQILVSDTRSALALMSANFYGRPAEQLHLLAVTGTNGKTTCTYLIKSILEQAGYKVGVIGTIKTLIGDLELESAHTTPESLDIQGILAKMVAAQVDYVVMEVSSHALEFKRTEGLSFRAVLFTNLSQDHLDFHGNMESYFAAKEKLFCNLRGFAVLNFDNEWGQRLQGSSSGPVLSYAVHNPADLRACKILLEKTGVSYILDSKAGQFPVKLQLVGSFNVYNSLGAAALCWSQGIAFEQIKKGLERLSNVPGRFERIDNQVGLNVIVDYAHTPDGLENVLNTAREMVVASKVIVVFGAGGDRDQAKRPLMGAIASRLADYVIITSDNPRSENPREICSSIEAGLVAENPFTQYEIVLDRREAIQRALGMADPGDLVIVAGKGHETYQDSATGRVHFDDREEVRLAIKELKQ